jgi:hypothetical protein
MSPVFYYDPRHYGMWFSLFEATLGLVLFRQFKSRFTKTSLAIALYVVVPAFFVLS